MTRKNFHNGIVYFLLVLLMLAGNGIFMYHHFCHHHEHSFANSINFNTSCECCNNEHSCHHTSTLAEEEGCCKTTMIFYKLPVFDFLKERINSLHSFVKVFFGIPAGINIHANTAGLIPRYYNPPGTNTLSNSYSNNTILRL